MMVHPESILHKNGFLIIPNVFSTEEIMHLSSLIDSAEKTPEAFRVTSDLFAIRSCLQTIPGTRPVIFNSKLKEIIRTFFGPGYVPVKSIYFDKPPLSNWFVAWHQDLTISVDKKTQEPGYTHWTEKQGKMAVQPPLSILENLFTIRIHLDDCDETNGALKVIPGTHLKGIVRPETLPDSVPGTLCPVPAGGIMIMKPLLMHASSRSRSERQRRVIHLEFSDGALPSGMRWREKAD